MERDLTFISAEGEQYDVNLPSDTIIQDVVEQFADALERQSKDISFFYNTYMLDAQKKISDYNFQGPIYIREYRRPISETIFNSSKEQNLKPNKKDPSVDFFDQNPEPVHEPVQTKPKREVVVVPPSPIQANVSDPKLQQLLNMGVDKIAAQNALDAAGGDIELATNFLFDSGIPGVAKQADANPMSGISDLQKQLSSSDLEWCKSKVTGGIDLDTVVQMFLVCNRNRDQTMALLSGQ